MRGIIPPLLLSATLNVIGLGALGVQPGECETINATVVSVDDQGITVQKADGTEARYALGTDLQVPSALSPGTQVDLTITEDVDGLQRVTAIQAEPTQSQSHPASSDIQAAGSDMQASGADVRELPATASPVWLLGVAGLVALLGGALVRRNRRIKTRKQRLAAYGIRLV